MSMRQLKITKSITNRESASLEKYLQEIGRVPLISPEEEVQLTTLVKQGDQECSGSAGKGQPAIRGFGGQAIPGPGTFITRSYQRGKYRVNKISRAV